MARLDLIVACRGSVGFDGLAGLDLMVVGLASVVVGWFSWWVCGLVEPGFMADWYTDLWQICGL